REPEVDDLEPALAGDEHVRRLEVAVEEAGPVQRVHAGGELAEREPEGGLGGRLAARAQVLEPAVPGDIVHGDVPLAAGPIERELVDGGEVGVADVDDVAELLLEPGDRGGVRPAQGLQGDLLAARAASLV